MFNGSQRGKQLTNGPGFNVLKCKDPFLGLCLPLPPCINGKFKHAHILPTILMAFMYLCPTKLMLLEYDPGWTWGLGSVSEMPASIRSQILSTHKKAGHSSTYL